MSTLREYEAFVDEMTTCTDPAYAFLGLAGETGEVVELMKKHTRGKDLDLDKLQDELGDVAWYWFRLNAQHGFDPKETLEKNMKKLYERRAKKERQWQETV